MNLNVFMYKALPKGLISRLFGAFTRIPLPGFIINPLITWYSRKYGVLVDEIDVPDGGFRTFNKFFTRTLKAGSHIIDDAPASVVSPVDARVDQYGPIDGNELIQAKGLMYRLEDLIPTAYHEKFAGGSFMTLYLSPGDYHRIHSPLKGKIEGYLHVPGKLFTVQESMVKSLPNLFCVNERLVSYVQSGKGYVAVCKIGATNVGRISLAYDSIITNKTFRRMKEVVYDTAIDVDKGGELGTFNLGSTIVLVFSKDMVSFNDIELGQSVRVGESIASLK